MTSAAAASPMARADLEAHRGRARELGAGVVQAVFRLIKQSTLHASDNQAVVRQIEETAAIVSEYGAKTGMNVSILFAQGSVFVAGQLLKANRTVYEGAIELGATLRKLGLVELTIARDAKAADIQALGQVVADAVRGQPSEYLTRPTPRVLLRPAAEATIERGVTLENLTHEQTIVRTYASAVVVMRRFYEAMSRGNAALPQRIKRVAQSLVELSEGDVPAFLGVTGARNANHDGAGKAINTAILSLAMARQITSDRLVLARLAMAALLFDVGRPRVVGASAQGRPGIQPTLSVQQEEELPVATAVTLLSFGRINETTIGRTVMAFEAHWLRQQASLGPVYDGAFAPTLQARILAIAKTFNDLVTPQPGLEPLGPNESIAQIELTSGDAATRTALRLLVAALGVFPLGALVELSTGEVAEVLSTPTLPSQYARPRVRIVFDEAGGMADIGEVDLAEPSQPGEPSRSIVRVVSLPDAALAETASGARAVSVDRSGPASAVRTAVAPPTSKQTDRAGDRSSVAKPHEERMSDPKNDALKASDAASRHRTQGPSPVPSAPAALAPPGRPDPTATGDFTRTPLVHLLVYMIDQELTGTTVLSVPGVEHCIYFDRGVPSKIKTGTMTATLDRVLLELGLVDETSLYEALAEVAKYGGLLGRALVMKGRMDNPALLRALKVQLVRKLSAMFELPDTTTYAYYQGANLIATYGGPELTPAEPLSIIMMGIRARAHDPRIDAMLTRLTGRPLGIHPQADLRRFGFEKVELAVVDVLRAQRMSLEQLVQAGVAQERAIRLVIYALAITRCLDLGVPGRPPILASASASVPEPRPSSSVTVSSTHPSVAQPAVPPAPASVGQPAATPAPPGVARATSAPAPASIAQPAATPAPPGVARATSAPAPASVAQPAAPPPPPPSANAWPAPAASARPVVSSPVAVARPVAATPSAAPSPASAPRPLPAASGAAAPPSATAVPAAPSVPGDRRAEIVDRHAKIDKLDHFQILGIAQDATPAQIQSAYFGLAKSWHPDRLPSDLADLKPQVSKVFARVSDAYQVLNDEKTRTAYVKEVKAGGGTPESQEKLSRAVEAAFEFQKAEIFLKKNELQNAENSLRAAVTGDPEQPEYLALLVWVRAQRRGEPPALAPGQSTSFYDDLIETLDAILKKEPRYERALFYRATLLKRAGRLDGALRDFRLSAEINPKNVDSVREVRLASMRNKQGGADAPPSSQRATEPTSSMFGKLFKK